MRNTNLKMRLFLILLILGSFAAAVSAQVGTGQAEVQTMKGAVIKGKAPVNKTILKVKRPKAQEAILTNGLRVIVLESNRVPTFSMEMVVMSGGLSDPTDMRGLANATATLLREGTAKHTSREIAEALDTMGASLGANSGLASFTTSITSSGLVENFDQVLDLFTEVVRTPKFPAAEVERYKSRTIAAQSLARGQAQFLAQERLNQAIYGTHPAALVLPPAESLKKISSADLTRFHTQHYLPNNAMLAIVGDVKLKEILPKLERAFGDWKSGASQETSIPAAPAQSASKIYLINRPGSVQTVFLIGSLAIDRSDPDYPAMSVMNRILGGGGSSRLFLNIREDKSYAYSVGSNFNASKYRGTFVANAPVRNEATEGALREFMSEFNRIRNEKVSPAELENAKRAIVGNFALSLENPGAILQTIITQKLYNFSADYWDTYPQKIEAVTAEDVQRVARKYIDLDHLQIVAVGDAAKAKDALAKYGIVEVYDSEGKPQTRAATTGAPGNN